MKEQKYPTISVVFSIDLFCKYIVISLLLRFDLPWTDGGGDRLRIFAFLITFSIQNTQRIN